jgi:hypothetical protein
MPFEEPPVTVEDLIQWAEGLPLGKWKLHASWMRYERRNVKVTVYKHGTVTIEQSWPNRTDSTNLGCTPEQKERLEGLYKKVSQAGGDQELLTKVMKVLKEK